MRLLHHIARAIYLLILVFTISGVLRIFAVAPRPHAPQPAPELAERTNISPDSITAASESLFLFISSTAAPQSSLFIQDPQEHLPSIEAYILHRTPQNVHVQYSRSDPSPPPHSQTHVHWFELEFEKDKRRFDVAIYPSPDGYKLNWLEFLEAYTASDPSLAGRYPSLPFAPVPGMD
ncbi:MAG: hypothetical protein AAGD22_08175 [Verrucomicrobiota bacterium]